MGSGDMVNTMLNYGYSLLEAEYLKAINTVGMEVHVGFLHEMTPGKNSLAYDLQEPFRFLVDLAVISLNMKLRELILTVLRQKILNISYVDWKKLGFSKCILRYMK